MASREHGYLVTWPTRSGAWPSPSFNYTQPANEYNDENIFVMGSTHAEVEGVEVEANASRQLAVHLKQEIQRIISLGKRYDPAA